jgi:hypothetical protein
VKFGQLTPCQNVLTLLTFEATQNVNIKIITWNSFRLNKKVGLKLLKKSYINFFVVLQVPCCLHRAVQAVGPTCHPPGEVEASDASDPVPVHKGGGLRSSAGPSQLRDGQTGGGQSPVRVQSLVQGSRLVSLPTLRAKVNSIHHLSGTIQLSSNKFVIMFLFKRFTPMHRSVINLLGTIWTNHSFKTTTQSSYQCFCFLNI